jgi:hypothetical protein
VSEVGEFSASAVGTVIVPEPKENDDSEDE